MHEENDTAEYGRREIRLEKLRVAAQVVVSENLLYDARLDIIEDMLTRQFRVTIRGSILKLGKGASMEIKYPQDWWQSFKERWFPDWALSRWPVRYKVHEIKAEALFPEASQRFALEPKLGPSYMTLFEETWYD